MRKKVILSAYIALLSILTIVSINANASCIAGGKGASACSISASAGYALVSGELSCSVECRDTHYACCTLSGCSCEDLSSIETSEQS